MKLHHYPKIDSFRIALRAEPGSETREKCGVVGIDIDLTAIAAVALPVSAVGAA